MEKLFQRNNIGIQHLVDENGVDVYYAYTEKLLAHNVLIKFYTAVLDDSEEDYEEETAIIVYAHTENLSYSFPLFHSVDVVGPLQLYRIIADAIGFLDHSTRDTILDDLAQIATGYSSSDVMNNPEDNKRIYETDVWRFSEVMDLIRKNA